MRPTKYTVFAAAEDAGDPGDLVVDASFESPSRLVPCSQL